ncbi:MAG: hypothetical protein RR814_05945 [Oscillospiraceae bacterium]
MKSTSTNSTISQPTSCVNDYYMRKNKADLSKVAQRPDGTAVEIEKSARFTISQPTSCVNTHYV